MVKNLPTVERSTKIRFGRNCKEDQAENTIVFNASNIQIDATIPGAVYMTPLRVQEELTDTNVTMMTYNTATKELMDSGVLASDVLLYDLEDVTINGNVTSNTMIFNGNTAFITYSNTTGISNSAPVHTLDVGSNLYIQDTGSNVLNVTGNANVTDALTTKELYVTNDTRIYGNLDVMGVVTSLRTENTTINDAIIQIANNNTISTTDMGIVMTKPETSVGIGYRGHENEFMVGFTQSDVSGTDLVPDSSNLIQMRVYGDLHVSNAFDVATRASIGSNVVIDDDVAETITVTGNVYTSRAAKVGSNAIIDTLASNVISVTGNTYTSHAVIVGSNAVIDTLASDVISVTGNAYVSHAIDVGSNIVLDDRSSDVLSLTGNAYVSRGIDVGSNVIIDTLGSDSIHVIGNIHSSRKITVGPHLTMDTLDSNVVQVIGNTFTSRASIIGSNIVLDDQALNAVEITGNAKASRAVFVGSNVVIDDLSEDVVSVTGNTYVSHAIDVGSNVVIDDLAPDVVSLTGNAYVSRGIDVGSNVIIDDLASNALSITGDAKITDTLTANYVSALEYYGDGGLLGNVNLQVVSDHGNSTSNTIRFTNPTTAFTTDLVSNVEVKLDQLSNVVIAAPQTDHILTYDGSNWVNEYNIHNFIKVHNLTGSTLYRGNVVYIVNSFNNNVANVALAKSNSSATMPAIGLIHENILNGEEGAAVAYGKVTGLNTTGYIEGQTIYVSNIHSGRVMNTKPYGLGDQIQNVGICIKAHENNGVIFVTGVGRSNDIPNAPIETVTSPYVYVNTSDNNLRKIVPSNLLTKLQTLEQVVNTGNVVSNVISASGFTATGDVAIGGLTENYIPIVGSNNILVDSPIRKDNGSIIIAADTEINGNLIVTGNSYVVSSNNVVIEDRILGLANNNPSHDYDVGVIMEHPGHNIALIHHGDEDRFSMGYTQNTVTDNHVLPDSNVFFLDILGNVEVQNNLVVNERIGISNLLPDHDLSVGSNLYVDDSGADVLVVTGNVLATRFIGDGGYLSNIASTFEDIIINGNTASNTVELRATTSLVTTGNVGISNLAPDHDLSVGSNLYVDDSGADVLVVTGNVLATRFIGDGGYLSNIASTFEDIIINGNTASNTVQLQATTSLVTTGNVGISNLAPEHDLSVGSNLYIDDDGADILVVTGNVLATRFIGDGGYLSNIASTFEDIIINGNTASNTVELRAATSLVTTGTVGIANTSPDYDLSVGSNLHVDDDGSNVLIIYGNTAMDALTLGLGEVTIVPSYGLNHVTAEYNQTDDTIILTNPTTGLIVNSNINVGSNIVFSGGASIQGLNLAPTASNIVTYDATTGEVFDSGGLISNKLAVVSEQPPSALTGVSTMIPQHGVYTVSTSTSDAYKVFDKTVAHWASGATYTGANNTYNGSSELFSGGELGEWIKIEIPYKTILRHISLTPAVDVASFPGSGYVYASNDDVTWTQLKTWSGIIPSSLTDIKKITIDAAVAYTKYAIVPTQAAGTSTSVNIGEWKLFTESFVIDGGIMSVTGNVGIGTNTPAYTLDINGDVNISNVLRVQSFTIGPTYDLDSVTAVDGTSTHAIDITDTTASTSKTTGALKVAGGLGVAGNVYADSLNVSSNLEVGTANLFVDTTTSNVGVGTTTPAYTLDINGDINFSGNVYQGASPFVGSLWTDGESSLYYRSNVEVGTANLFVDTTTGAVGIGTTTPAQALEVSGKMRVSNVSDSSFFSDMYAYQVASTTWNQLPKLTASDAAANEYFGQAVSISGDGNTAIVGATGDDSNRGSAYIFTYSGGSWSEQQKITASDGAVNDYFGQSVAISSDGNTAIVGAYQEDPGGLTNAGSVYIFTRSGGTWSEQQKITASDAATSDYFGYSVAISGDGNTAIVGAYFEVPGGVIDAGSAYIFTYSGSTWSEQQKITASDKATNDRFGWSVAISGDGNTALVGAYLEDPGGVGDAGSAYIFTRSGSTWSEQAKLVASDAASGDNFGYSVAISGDGNTAIMGARQEDPGGLSDAGSAYIFTYSGGTWSEQAKLVASDAAANDYFSQSVSLSSDGNTAIVGVFFDDDPIVGADAGSAYIFTRSGGTWSEQTKLVASDKATSDYFGVSVAISGDGNTAIVGANFEDPGGLTNAGSAYIFSKPIYNALNVSTPITADGTLLSFTGQHICFPDGPMSEGLVVSANKNKYLNLNGPLTTGLGAIKSSESLPVVTLSNVTNDRSVFGVVDRLESGGTVRNQTTGITIVNATKELGDNRVIVNAIGEGAMWVANTNGNLVSGDYITTSNIAGYGQKQDSEFLANYTVAKITMDCDFNPEDLPVQVIKKDSEGKNVLDTYGRLQWEDTDRTQKAYTIRYLTADGVRTDHANAVWTAAYVGCTYHCG